MHNLESKLLSVFNVIASLLNTRHFTLAGGSIVNIIQEEQVNDFDIFIENREAFDRLRARMELEDSYLFYIITHRKNSFQVEIGKGFIIDIVHTTSQSAKEIIEDFDFVHCAIAYNPNEGVVSLPNTMECIVAKRLEVNKLKLPVHTLKRVGKYLGRGYSVNGNVIQQISEEFTNRFGNLNPQNRALEDYNEESQTPNPIENPNLTNTLTSDDIPF